MVLTDVVQDATSGRECPFDVRRRSSTRIELLDRSTFVDNHHHEEGRCSEDAHKILLAK
jgi:hypothetical protein